jgi:hypothetical protein
MATARPPRVSEVRSAPTEVPAQGWPQWRWYRRLRGGRRERWRRGWGPGRGLPEVEVYP